METTPIIPRSAQPLILTLEQAADCLGYANAQAMRNAIRQGFVPFKAFQRGKILVVKAADVTAYVDGLKVGLEWNGPKDKTDASSDTGKAQ